MRFKKGDLVLFRAELNDGSEVKNFILGTVESVVSDNTVEMGWKTIRLQRVLWSDFIGWKARAKKRPFDTTLAWGCNLLHMWKVKSEEEARAIIMGSKL